MNPDAHKLHSNRAACYTKLGAWADGLKDAEECIRLEPSFIKGYRWACVTVPAGGRLLRCSWFQLLSHKGAPFAPHWDSSHL